MKRMILILIVLFTATTLFAGGKECDMKKHASKSVELTGTLIRTGEGDDAKTIFKVANSDQSYDVCEKTKNSILSLANEGTQLQIKGKVMNCSEGEELVIETAKKI
jgi:hypothetical protein